jgi:hypothetical protein
MKNIINCGTEVDMEFAMKRAGFALCGLLLCTGTSFAEPLAVPASKAAYVGDWQGKDMELRISANGKIFYKRNYSAEKKVNLDMEITGFNGDNFDAGFGIIHSTFYVTKPPAKSGATTKMTVDGVELTKVN